MSACQKSSRGRKKSPTEKKSNGNEDRQKKKSKVWEPGILTPTNSNNTNYLDYHLSSFYDFSEKKVQRKKGSKEKKVLCSKI